MFTSIAGRAVVVTGATRGIGKGIARVLALLTPPELGPAMAKMRARRTPSTKPMSPTGLTDPLLIQCSVEEALELELGMRGAYLLPH